MKKKTIKQYAEENTELRRQLRDSIQALQSKSRETAQSTIDNVLNVDLDRRAHDSTIMELIGLSEQLKARADERARNCLIHGWGRADMPSSITVEHRMAKRIRAIAEREAGHSFDFLVRA